MLFSWQHTGEERWLRGISGLTDSRAISSTISGALPADDPFT